MTVTTLELFKALIDAGIEDEKAQRITNAVITKEEASSFATKSDIQDLKLDMYKFIFVSLFGQTIAVVGLTVGLIKLLG